MDINNTFGFSFRVQNVPENQLGMRCGAVCGGGGGVKHIVRRNTTIREAGYYLGRNNFARGPSVWKLRGKEGRMMGGEGLPSERTEVVYHWVEIV